MVNFFQILRSSIFDPEFYNRARKQSLKPLIKIYLVLGLVGLTLSMAVLVPDVLTFVRSDPVQKITDIYPDDLVLTIRGGELSINQPEPYYISNPFASDPIYAVIFDGKDKLSGDPQENSTFVLIKKKYAIISGDDQPRVLSFSQIGTTSIQKSSVVTFANAIRPYVPFVIFGGGLLLFIFILLLGSVFWVAFHMLYVFIPAGIIYVISSFRSKLPFRDVYIMASYASIPVAILFYILFDFLLSFPRPPYVYTLLLLLIAALNISRLPKSDP